MPKRTENSQEEGKQVLRLGLKSSLRMTEKVRGYVVPGGLGEFFDAFPVLKRWAFLWRARGAGRRAAFDARKSQKTHPAKIGPDGAPSSRFCKNVRTRAGPPAGAP